MCVEFSWSLRKVYLDKADCFHCVLIFIAGALGETRTLNTHPLKMVRLPIAPPGQLRFVWCPPRDSNSHTRRYQNLNLARLPISPKGLKYCMHEREKIYVKDLYRLFATEPYTTTASWVNTKHFVADPLLNPAEFHLDTALVPPPGIEPGSSDFQSGA